MSGESVVKASVIFDTSDLQEGVQTSVAGLKQMAEQASVTSETVKTKSQAMALAAKQAASVITQADLDIAASANVAARARANLSIANRDVKNGVGNTTDALTIQAAAMRQVREAALAQAAALDAVAASEEVTGRAAASGVVRMMEGNAGIRAVENFMSKTLGLGPALQKIFPVVGALAFGTILIDGAEKLENLRAQGKGAGDALSSAFGEMDEKLSASNDELELTNSKLEDQIAKISGHPTNGLQTALLEAKVAADKVLESLSGDVREFDKLLQEKSVSEVEGDLSGVASTGAMFGDLKNQTEKLQKDSAAAKDVMDTTLLAAKAAHDKATAEAAGSNAKQLAADNAFRAAQLAASKDYYATQASLAAKYATTARKDAGDIAAMQGHSFNSQDLTPMRSAEEDAAVMGDRLQRRAQLAAANLDDNSTLGQMKQGGKPPKDDGANKAAEDRLHAMEAERVKEEAEGKLGAQADLDYWAARIKAFAAGSEQYKAIQEKMQGDTAKLSGDTQEYNAEQARAAENTARNAQALKLANIQMELASGKITKTGADNLIAAAHTAEYTAKIAALRAQLAALNADKDASPEEKKVKGAGIQNQIDDAQGQEATAAIEGQVRATEAKKEADTAAAAAADRLAEATAKSSEIAIKQAFSFQEGAIRIAWASGAMTPLAAAMNLFGLHTAESTQKLKALNAELAALKAASANAPANASDAEKKTSAAKIQELENQIAQLQGQQANQGQQDQAAVATQLSKPFLSAFSDINNGWLKVQGDLIQGNAFIGQAFAQMGLKLVQDMAASFEQMLAKQAEMEIKKIMLHRMAQQANAQSDVAAAAASDTVSLLSAIKQAGHAAKVAAAKAWKAYADVPPVPVVGAIAAAATYAGVMAMAAFEHGGIVGGSPGMGVPILAHAGERVLTTSQTNNFERMVNNSQSSTRGGDTHFHMGGNTYSGARDQPTINDRQFTRQVKRLQRQGQLTPARQSIL